MSLMRAVTFSELRAVRYCKCLTVVLIFEEHRQSPEKSKTIREVTLPNDSRNSIFLTYNAA